MGNIKVLDSVTVSKIAAGEVIDRPASVVKELLENSLDAKASKIRLTLEEGGKKRIQVEDNGTGILPDDLSKAPLRHATSKIHKMEDIYSVESYGFRGEALASMAHAGRLEISSKTLDHPAYHIDVYQDQISGPQPHDRDQGTTVILKDLFLGLPVRQRFLKTPGTETSYVYSIVQHLAMLHPTVDFVMLSDGQEQLNTTGIKDPLALARLFWGKNTVPHLKPVNTSIGPFHFKGLISDPALTAGSRLKQITAVGGRLIKNPTISKAIQVAYQDLIPKNRHPYVCLNITSSEEDMDVNIHPQKMDVKFVNPSHLFDAIRKMVAETLGNDALLRTGVPEMINETPTLSESTEPTVSHPAPTSQASQFNSLPFTPLTETQTERRTDGIAQVAQTSQLDTLYNQEALKELDTVHIEYLHILDTYIALKTPSGLLLLDQHAVHERILYERIKDKFEEEMLGHPLLVAEVLDLDRERFNLYESAEPALHYLGFECEVFGDTQVVFREVPSAFQGISLRPWLEDFLEQQVDRPGSSRDLTLDQKEMLQMKACKAAIKAGRKMHNTEVLALLKDLIKSPNNYTCPHGRPLFVELDKAKLERLFLRS